MVWKLHLLAGHVKCSFQEERIGFRGEFALQPNFKKRKRGMFVHTVSGGIRAGFSPASLRGLARPQPMADLFPSPAPFPLHFLYACYRMGGKYFPNISPHPPSPAGAGKRAGRNLEGQANLPARVFRVGSLHTPDRPGLL